MIERSFYTMAFFDNLSKKAQDVASVAGGKAKMAADTAKLNMQIASEQREIEKDYKTIGEWYVAEYADEAPEAIADVVAAIRAAKEKIIELEEAKEQRRTAEDDVVPAEGSVVEEAAEAPAEAAESKVCPVCGNVSQGKFCPQCGAPMGE
jgi:DNA repair exonuclease SbcCD ATPase subunit